MPIASLRSILDHALEQHYAVGYFEAWDLYSLEAVIESAEALRSPAILGFGAAVTEAAWLNSGGVEELATAARLLAERASVPTAVLFNEAQTAGQAFRGLAAGCNCLMLDSSHLNFQDNIAATQSLVAMAHAAGAEVEAELGRLPTSGDLANPVGDATDPEQAAAFVKATGIDVLAVSIGNVHLLSSGQATLDLDRLQLIHQLVPLPLVLHGGTGLPAAGIKPAIARGVAKINYGTRLKQVFLAGMQEGLAALPKSLNVHTVIGSRAETDVMWMGKQKMKQLIGNLIQFYGSAGRAPASGGQPLAAPGFDVMCVGILVADLFVPPLPRLPRPGELQLVDDMLLAAGGCAANAAMDLAKLGVPTAVGGKVGNDFFAGFVRDELAAKGLDVSGIRASTTAPTARTVILPVTGDDRRYIHAVGANAELRVEDIDLDQVAQARVLFVGGYLLFPGMQPAALAGLFQFARERGIQTVLDVAGPKAGQGMEPLTPVLPYTDVFLPNDDEAAAMTGERDPWRQAEVFAGCGARTTVITRGGEGVVVRTPSQSLAAPALPFDFVDGSGAGDAFAAGYIVGLLEGWDLERTLAFASAIGGSACTRLGTTAGVLTRPEALDYLARHVLHLNPRPA